MARPTSPTILPDHASLHLVRLEADEQSILAVVTTTSSEALCPLCQCRSESVHSRYVRCVADLPWAGWAVRLELHVRRFFCSNKECVRQIFTERLPGVVAPYARSHQNAHEFTERAGHALIHIKTTSSEDGTKDAAAPGKCIVRSKSKDILAPTRLLVVLSLPGECSKARLAVSSR